MTRPIAEATIVGDFRPGTHLEQYGRAYKMESRDGRYFITVSRGTQPAETFEVHYTLGVNRFQGYLTKLPDGRIYVLPAFWHNAAKRWVDWKEITPIPDDTDHDLRQIWNVTCVNCHATNLVRHFDAATRTYATTWTEMGIACEACHGPGGAHISSPATSRMFAPRDATTRQIFDTCSYCHGNKTNEFFGFTPGDRYEDYALPFLISDPLPPNDPQGEFWPDGRPSRFNRPQALMLTGCFRTGQATCTKCHAMHGPRYAHSLKIQVEDADGAHTRQSDALCTQCHTVGADDVRKSPLSVGRAPLLAAPAGPAVPTGSPTGLGSDLVAPRTFADLTAHTHHAPDSPGSRCIDCHMSEVNWRMITRRRDHTFQAPVPEITTRFGAPNACTTCHEDKSPEWAASIMDTWYGNGDRRRATAAMADTMYRAGAGDPTVLPELARLAVDRSRGAPIRASAAAFMGQLLARVAQDVSPASPALRVSVVNALFGAAADPEPIVRIAAIRALGLVDEPRVPAVLAAHLTDQVRLVRVSAAEGLMSHRVTRLDDARGQALARAQDEWMESLRTFNDVAEDHTTLGWLEASLGRAATGADELKTAISLDPQSARAYVYLGVLAARAGDYAQALRHWKVAKTLAPTYQNLDLLIEAAQRELARK